MNQKNYVLRGGILLTVLWLLMNIYNYFFSSLVPEILGWIMSPFYAIAYLSCASGNNTYEACTLYPALGLVLSAILYFILGALLGWIYGKMKNRTS